MTDLPAFHAALEPVVAFLRGLDPADPALAERLTQRFPPAGPELTSLRTLLRTGVAEGWLAERENGGIRFSRAHKASSADDWSVEVVHMDRPGPGHEHPRGEVSICFAVSGEPNFDGHAEGWVVYGPRSWHVPTVAGGVMDIVYFLPGGEIRFGPKQ